MASIIDYKNISVSVNGSTLYATSASFSFEAPTEAIRSLGEKNAVTNIINNRTEGTIDINYVVTNTSDPGKIIFDNIISGSYSPSTIIIGNRTFSGYFSSHNLSAQQNSVIEASLSFNIFNIPNFSTMLSSSPESNIIDTIGHGGNSFVDTLSGAIGFEYNASVEWEPVYGLGKDAPAGVIFNSAEQRVTLTGPNCGEIVSRCIGLNNLNLSIGSLCGNELFNIPISGGIIRSSESSVEAGNFVEATYEIIKLY